MPLLALLLVISLWSFCVPIGAEQTACPILILISLCIIIFYVWTEQASELCASMCVCLNFKMMCGCGCVEEFLFIKLV
jgi:hypothetical protein